jgi:hypothetical protein
MADQHSLGVMSARFLQERERSTYRTARLLGHPEEYEPSKVDPRMQGDRDLILTAKIDGGLLSTAELLEELTKLVITQQSQIKALTEKVETPKGSKKS